MWSYSEMLRYFLIVLLCISSRSLAQSSKDEVIREGSCPFVNIPPECPSLVANGCLLDNECPGREKCCTDGCELHCTKVSNFAVWKPGVCPLAYVRITCPYFTTNKCNVDIDCPGDEKCCSDGCVLSCLPPFIEISPTTSSALFFPTQGPEGSGGIGDDDDDDDDDNIDKDDDDEDNSGFEVYLDISTTPLPTEKPSLRPAAVNAYEAALFPTDDDVTTTDFTTTDVTTTELQTTTDPPTTEAPVVKAGMCPTWSHRVECPPRRDECQQDNDCTGNDKCCFDWCENVCVLPEFNVISTAPPTQPSTAPTTTIKTTDPPTTSPPTTSPPIVTIAPTLARKNKRGRCPVIVPPLECPVRRWNRCLSDVDCQGKLKCCSDGCELVCHDPQSEVVKEWSGWTPCECNHKIWGLKPGFGMQHRIHSCKNPCPEFDGVLSCPKSPVEYRSCDCGYVPPADPGLCPPSPHAQGHKRKQGRFWWPEARPGTVVYLNCPFGPEHSFAQRNCTLGKFGGLATWEAPDLNNCNYSSEITKALDKLSQIPVTKDNAVITMQKLENISTQHSGYQAIDVIMTSQILESVLDTREMISEVGEDIIETVGMVMNVDINVMNESQVEDTGPKRLVKVLDRYSEEVPLFEPSIKHVVPNLGLEALIVQPETFQGASFTAEKPSDPIRGLLSADVQTSADTRGSESAEVSLVLPKSLFKENFINSPITREERVSFKVFRNGHLFPEMNLEAHNLTLNTRVVSASVKGRTISDLSDPVITSFRTLRSGDPDTAECKYWDFNANSGTGAWSSEGCRKVSHEGDKITCHCDHLTNFAILMELSDEGEPMAYEHRQALSIISYIGCGISLLGLTLTLITFVGFKELRRTNPPRILINLCLALMFTLIVFIVGAERTSNVFVCRIMAGLIHYFVLAAFLWMAVEAFNMYLCFVKIIPSRISMFILKCCLFAWGVPAIIVTVTMGLKFDHYGGKSYCRLKGIPFYGAFMIPSLTIILFNLVVFIMVLISLFTSRSNLTADKRTSGMLQARRAAAIMVLLGLTWIFGVLAVSDAKIVFQYLFCIFNSLQGFFIFCFYCYRQDNVRRKWKEFFCTRRKKKDSKKNRPRTQVHGGTKQSLERQEAFKHALSNNMYGSESVKHCNTGESDPPENLTLEQSRFLQTVTIDENSFKRADQSAPSDETTSL